MFSRVMVATDGSVFGDAALPLAADLAHAYHGTLDVVCIIPDPLIHLVAAGPYSYNYPAEDRAGKEGGELTLKRSVALALALKLDGLTVSGRLIDGLTRDVASCLTEAAETLNADVVVMSTHGHGGLLKTLLGSVAERVLRQVHVPVLLIQPAHKPAQTVLSGQLSSGTPG